MLEAAALKRDGQQDGKQLDQHGFDITASPNTVSRELFNTQKILEGSRVALLVAVDNGEEIEQLARVRDQAFDNVHRQDLPLNYPQSLHLGDNQWDMQDQTSTSATYTSHKVGSPTIELDFSSGLGHHGEAVRTTPAIRVKYERGDDQDGSIYSLELSADQQGRVETEKRTKTNKADRANIEALKFNGVQHSRDEVRPAWLDEERWQILIQEVDKMDIDVRVNMTNRIIKIMPSSVHTSETSTYLYPTVEEIQAALGEIPELIDIAGTYTIQLGVFGNQVAPLEKPELPQTVEFK